jgi:hypothetical protein
MCAFVCLLSNSLADVRLPEMRELDESVWNFWIWKEHILKVEYKRWVGKIMSMFGFHIRS